MIAGTGCAQERCGTTTKDSGDALGAEVADAIRRHLNGDQTAMTDIVRRVTPWLFRVVRGYRLSRPASEDVVQNTLLELWQHAGRLREPRTALAWLSVVARHEALRMIKVDRRLVPVGDMTALDPGVDTDDPEHVMIVNVARRVVRKNLAKLPARSRDLLQLAFLADVRDYATLSAALDMPIGSIGPTRQRGLQKMRDLVNADDEWRLDRSA